MKLEVKAKGKHLTYDVIFVNLSLRLSLHHCGLNELTYAVFHKAVYKRQLREMGNSIAVLLKIQSDRPISQRYLGHQEEEETARMKIVI